MVTGILVTIFTFLWSLLFIIPGIVKSYSYAMAFYIRNDYPGYTATEAVTKSREMMRGYKGKLFFHIGIAVDRHKYADFTHKSNPPSGFLVEFIINHIHLNVNIKKRNPPFA
jgi:hypothetical protein